MSCLFAILGIALPASTYAGTKNSVIATINVGVNPDAIAIIPDSYYAYVVNNNNYKKTTR